MLKFRRATVDDTLLYFEWANDAEVRAQSFSSQKINFEDHKKWFLSKLMNKECFLFVFTNESNTNIGQVRIQEENEQGAIIGLSIAAEFRGQGYAKEMLKLASDFFLSTRLQFVINAYIKESNLNSKYAFENAGFEFVNMIEYENFNSFHYIKKLK
ncbi:GNAT family N-acetyltransferase [Pedobacter planticolens]|nr:GNAT family N-acetyltransferase [Pedobacter planticolens]